MMKIKMIALTFAVLFLFGVAAFSTDGPAGPVGSIKDGPAPPIIDGTAPAVGGAVVYEVMVPGILFPGDELTPDQLKMLVMSGVVRPEGESTRQLGIVEGNWCHLVVSGQGTDIWVFCILGRGSVNCACSWGLDPATE